MKRIEKTKQKSKIWLIYGQLISETGKTAILWREENMIFNIVLEQLEKQKKVKREPWFTYFTYYKNELELNLNVKPIKHLEDLCNLGLAKDFLDITPNIWPIKEKNYKFDLNKTNNSILKNISKIWTDNSAMYRWQINMWKDTQYHLKWAKCKLKHNNLSLYLLDKLKNKWKS